MQASSIPYKFKTPWAQNATAPTFITSPIPEVSVGPAAGQDLGFPPATATDPSAGGTPPNINDENGVLNYETLWSQWVQAGGPIGYDATFSTNIGGYPKGAVISAASLGGFWLSTVDNNTSDPDTGGANWTAFSTVHGSQYFTSSGTFTVPAGVTRLFVQVWGGGGGGGSGTSSGAAGSGGGGAGYVEKLCTVTPGQTIAVFVGPGGAGASGANNGTPGGISQFGPFCSAAGGGGGFFSSGGGQSTVGSAGTGSSGDLNLFGQTGGAGLVLGGTPLGGNGGGTFGSSTGFLSPDGGSTGFTPGGGGSGAGGINSGGNGGAGLIIVRW